MIIKLIINLSGFSGFFTRANIPGPMTPCQAAGIRVGLVVEIVAGY